MKLYQQLIMQLHVPNWSNEWLNKTDIVQYQLTGHPLINNEPADECK